jgi:HrpA-like RNA helicase
MSGKSRRNRRPGAVRNADARRAESQEALTQLAAKKKAEADAPADGESMHLFGQQFVQAMASYIGKSTGPVGEAMVLVQALQMSQPVPPDKLALIAPKPVDEAEALRQRVAELEAQLAVEDPCDPPPDTGKPDEPDDADEPLEATGTEG